MPAASPRPHTKRTEPKLRPPVGRYTGWWNNRGSLPKSLDSQWHGAPGLASPLVENDAVLLTVAGAAQEGGALARRSSASRLTATAGRRSRAPTGVILRSGLTGPRRRRRRASTGWTGPARPSTVSRVLLNHWPIALAVAVVAALVVYFLRSEAAANRKSADRFRKDRASEKRAASRSVSYSSDADPQE